MSATKVQVHIYESGLHNETTVPIGSSALKKLRLKPEQSVTLRFGSAAKEVKLIPVSNLSGIRLHPQLAAALGIAGNCTITAIHRSGSRVLSLGPLIGVMLRKIHSGSPEKLFGKNASFCEEMSRACANYGAYVYFFSPDDIHGDHTINGWLRDGDRWIRKMMPIPNIVYNRLTSRVIEDSPKVQQFIQNTKARFGTHVFNEKYLHKNEVFDALRKEQGLASSLPESHALRSSAALRTMVSRYSTVFLKPIKGSLGRGIVRIRRTGEGFQCDFTAANGLRKQVYPTLEKLARALHKKVKTGIYQIQQGIDIVTVGGRPVDFRAVVQRGSTGEWGVTSIVARIAGNRTFVSNLARGGTLSTVEDALARSTLPPHLRSSVNTRLRSCAIDVAKGIEMQIQSHFAELGIDLAADVQGNVWLIEVNSKPSKEDNSALEPEPGKIRPSVKRIVRYSLFLAKA